MKDNNSLKIILIFFLSLIIAALIYFYVYDNETTDGEVNPVINIKPVTSQSLSVETDSIFFSFGIKKEWIKEINPKDKELKNSGTDLLISKEVLIPGDLPVIELNYEIINYLRQRNFDAKVTEDPRSKNLLMNIFKVTDTSKKTTGLIKINYTDSINRNSAYVSIVIDSIDANSLSDAEEILRSPQEFSVFLPLRNDKSEYQSLIIELKRDNLINFTIGNEDDISADFRDNMKESQWKAKVKSASVNFTGSGGVVLKNSGSNKDFYNNVKNEFSRSNIKVYEDTIFTEFRHGENKVSSLIENIISENRNGKKILFYSVYFTDQEFIEFEKKISGLRKSGYRFYRFNELINKINKNN